MKKDKQSIQTGTDLVYNCELKTWEFLEEVRERRISVISWDETLKGAITEIYFKDKDKEFIIEILERNFNREFYIPRDYEGTAKIIMNVCQQIAATVDTSPESMFPNALKDTIEVIMCHYYPNEAKEAHIYYGLGEFFGIKKEFTFFTEQKEIPARSIKCPGTRMSYKI